MTTRSDRHDQPPTDDELVDAFRHVLSVARRRGMGIPDRRTERLPEPDLHPKAGELRQLLMHNARVAEVMEYMGWANSEFVPGSMFDTLVLTPEIRLVVWNIVPPPPPPEPEPVQDSLF